MTLEEIKKLHGHDCEILYKEAIHEPYVQSGMGIAGGVLYKEETDEVGCNDCGWFGKNLSVHIRRIHRYSSIKEYKATHGLFQKTPLVSKAISFNRSKAAQGRMPPKNNKIHLAKRPYSNGNQTMANKNAHDLCPLQIQRRLEIVALLCGRGKIADVKSADIYKTDKKLYRKMINDFGNVENACKNWNIENSFRMRLDDKRLISELREYVLTTAEIPTKETLKDRGLRDYKTYVKHFGSWNRTKQIAGLNSLLQEVLIQRSQQKVLDRL